jgi:pSer/pThr/pTyr-binding forkhead associated (FHA) protein
MHLALLGVLLMFIAPSAYGQQSGEEGPPQPRLTIMGTRYTVPQQVEIDVVARQGTQTLTNLQAINFSVDEPHENLQRTVRTDGPMVIGILIDLSFGGDLALIRRSLSAFANNYFQDGDTAIVLRINSRTPNVVRIQSRGELATLANSLQLAANGNFFRVNDFLPTLLSELQAEDNPRKAAMLIGSLQYNRAESNASRFAAAGIALHVVQAHTTRQDSQQSYNAMARLGGGSYVNNVGGSLSPGENEDARASGALQELYSLIDNQRTYYALRYRSQNQQLDDTRTARLTVLVNAAQANASYTYAPQYLPPNVEFVAPSNTAPIRDFLSASNTESPQFDNNEETLVVRVTFPDGIERTIRTLRFEAANDRGAPTVPVELNNPIDGAGDINLTWDLRGYNQAETNYGVTLAVTVIDARGLTASTQTTGTVSVEPIPLQPTFTPQPTFTAAPTFTPVPTFTPQPTAASQIFGENVAAEADVFAFGGAAVAALVAGLTAMFFAFTRPGRAVVRGVVDLGTTFVETATSVFGADDDDDDVVDDRRPPKRGTLAELQPMKGLDSKKPIRITRTPFILGRVLDAGCDAAVPNSAISARHAQIESLSQTLHIRDLESQNLTYLNGKVVRPDREPRPLKEGDIIGLSKKVELRLHIVSNEINRGDQTVMDLPDELDDFGADKADMEARYGYRDSDMLTESVPALSPDETLPPLMDSSYDFDDDFSYSNDPSNVTQAEPFDDEPLFGDDDDFDAPSNNPFTNNKPKRRPPQAPDVTETFADGDDNDDAPFGWSDVTQADAFDDASDPAPRARPSDDQTPQEKPKGKPKKTGKSNQSSGGNPFKKKKNSDDADSFDDAGEFRPF